MQDNWDSVYTSWRAGNITAVQAMKDTGLTKPTFYSLVKRYESK